MEINDVFRRTMSDVARTSNYQQRPALYTDFGEIVYLRPPVEVIIPEEEQQAEQIFYTQPAPQPFYPTEAIKPEASALTVKFSAGLLVGFISEDLKQYWWNGFEYISYDYASTDFSINYLSPTINLRFVYKLESGFDFGLGGDVTLCFLGYHFFKDSEKGKLYKGDITTLSGGTLAPYVIAGYKNYNLHLGYDFIQGGLYISPNFMINKYLLVGLQIILFGDNHRGLSSMWNPPKSKVGPTEEYSDRNSFSFGVSTQFVF